MPVTSQPMNSPASSWLGASPNWRPICGCLPALIVYGIFKLYPLVSGLQMSLLRWDGIEEPRYIGLRNFEKILSDPMTGTVLMNNVHYAVGTVVGKIVLSLLLAILLHQALKGRTFYRTSLFMPVVMSFVVVGVLWSWLFNPQFGLINSFPSRIGLGIPGRRIGWAMRRWR